MINKNQMAERLGELEIKVLRATASPEEMEEFIHLRKEYHHHFPPDYDKIERELERLVGHKVKVDRSCW